MAKSDINLCHSMAAEHDGWAEIHVDLLDEITKHIDSYNSYARIRAVCKQWRCKLSKHPKYIEKLWLVLPFDDEKETFRPFLDVGQNEHCYVELSETRNTRFRGSYYEWLIMIAVDGTVRMLNPFTKVQVDLPPFWAFPNISEYRSINAIDKAHMQKFQIKKIIISSQPEHIQDFIALAIYGERCQLCYYRIGDNSWTAFEDFGTIVVDGTFHEGKIYVMNWRAELYQFKFDTNTRKVSGGIVPVVPPLTEYGYIKSTIYVVGTPLALLLVDRQFDVECDENERGYIYKTCGFKVYKLIRDGEKVIWVEVNNLGYYVLLLGYNTSMCMLPQFLPNAKGNRIYCSDDKYEYHDQSFFGGQDIGVFDLEDGSFNQIFPYIGQLFLAPVWLLK